ncbi:Hypothetical predicted protein [Pelobates cultripes]|uniref:Uncharacterized protein n=1 Tax=Pelobates cultripes TaxID=61616 RepID=A0AAD1WNN6_PELCU|nr:Hypothetical predicted protein [Pelobates cultripes]
MGAWSSARSERPHVNAAPSEKLKELKIKPGTEQKTYRTIDNCDRNVPMPKSKGGVRRTEPPSSLLKPQPRKGGKNRSLHKMAAKWRQDKIEGTLPLTPSIPSP